MTCLVFLSLSLAIILFVLPAGLAGPSCARKNWQSANCISTCQTRWGFPGMSMGTNPWGVVMLPSTASVETVVSQACGISSPVESGPPPGPIANSANSPVNSSDPNPAIIHNVAYTVIPSTLSLSATYSSVPTDEAIASSLVLSETPHTATLPTSQVILPTNGHTFVTPVNVKPTPVPVKETPINSLPLPVSVKETPVSPSPPINETSVNSPLSSSARKLTPTPAPIPAPSPKTIPPASSSNSITVFSDNPSGSTSNSDEQTYLSAHNLIRAEHGAVPLTWSDNLASKAQQWADNCVFKHSGGTLGPFGENLAAGTGSNYGITAAVKSWTDESSQYDANNPQPSHFTQVVWKATTQVGCAVQNCNSIFAASLGPAKYFVCEYSPQGNVIGRFAENVQV